MNERGLSSSMRQCVVLVGAMRFSRGRLWLAHLRVRNINGVPMGHNWLSSDKVLSARVLSVCDTNSSTFYSVELSQQPARFGPTIPSVVRRH